MAFSLRTVAALLAATSALLGASPLFAQEATPATGDAAPADPKLEEARAISARAERLFDAGHFQAALVEYTRAYDILAGHPRQYFLLYNLAACNERLFRYDVALRFYQQYLARAPETEPDRAEVVAIMRTLRALLGTLVVDSSVPASIWVDDRKLGTAPGQWLLPAGKHVIEARAELRESIRQEVELGAGQQLRLRFDPQRLSSNTGPSPGYFWAATALTGVAAVTGTIFGFKALAASREGRDRAKYVLDTQSEAERTRSDALAADIGFASAALFGASAAVLYFITDWTPSQRPAPGSPTAAPPRRTLSLTPSGFSASLRMEF